MKVPLQDKIAELESRIAGLEERERLLMGRSSQQTVTTTTTVTAKGFGEHWSKMWEEFHLVMKEAFGGKA